MAKDERIFIHRDIFTLKKYLFRPCSHYVAFSAVIFLGSTATFLCHWKVHSDVFRNSYHRNAPSSISPK